MSKRLSPRGAWWMLAALCCLGAFLRLQGRDLFVVTGDQMRDIAIARAIADGKSLPLLGPVIRTSQAQLGPFYYYFLSIPFRFSPNPVAANVLIALLHVGALALCFGFVASYFGRRVALATVTFLATSPGALVHSIEFSNIALLLPFTILLMWSLFAVMARGRSSGIIPVLVLLALLMQLHLTSVALLAVAVMSCLLFRPRLRRLHLLIGLLLALCVSLPWMAYEAMHQFENSRGLLRLVTDDQFQRTGHRYWSVIREALRLSPFTSWGQRPGMPESGTWPTWLWSASWSMSALECLLLNIGIFRALWALIHPHSRADAHDVGERRCLVLLLLWLVIPTLMVGTMRSWVSMWYLYVLAPSQYMFMGLALWYRPRPARAPKVNRLRVEAMKATLVAFMAAVQSFSWMTFLQGIEKIGVFAMTIHPIGAGSVRESQGVTRYYCSWRSLHSVLRALADTLGLQFPADFLRVHWTALGPLDDGGERLLTLLPRSLRVSTAATFEGRPHAAHALHYRVRDMRSPQLVAGLVRSILVQPFAIDEYLPAIDATRWSYAFIERNDFTTPLRRTNETTRPLTHGTHLVLKDQTLLLIQGVLRIDAPRDTLRLHVTIFGTRPAQVTGCFIDHQRALLQTSGAILYSCWGSHAQCHLPELSSGEHHIAIAVQGPTEVVDFDIYEEPPLPERVASFRHASF